MEYVKLSEIASVEAGGTPRRDKKEFWNGNIPWIKISDINDSICDSYTESITDLGLNSSSAKIFKKGTILYTIFATVGEVAKLKIDASTNQAIAGININTTKCLNDYLFYFFKAIKKKVLFDSKGVAQNNINLTYLRNILVPLPLFAMQKTIVSILDSLSNSIINDQKQLGLYDELIKSRFIEMFGDPIFDDKWNKKSLNELCDVRDGTHDSPKYINNGYPFVTSKNLCDGTIDFSTCQLISKEDYLHFSERSCVDDGDILMPMIGTVGGATIVNKDREFAIKNVALIKFTKTNINNIFVKFILNSDAMNLYFDNLKKGGTQKFISLGNIRNIPTICPPIELQNEFASFVELIDKSKVMIQERINKTQELLDKKMNEYFGEEN